MCDGCLLNKWKSDREKAGGKNCLAASWSGWIPCHFMLTTQCFLLYAGHIEWHLQAFQLLGNLHFLSYFLLVTGPLVCRADILTLIHSLERQAFQGWSLLPYGPLSTAKGDPWGQLFSSPLAPLNVNQLSPPRRCGFVSCFASAKKRVPAVRSPAFLTYRLSMDLQGVHIHTPTGCFFVKKEDPEVC